jgi:hypothetical protein
MEEILPSHFVAASKEAKYHLELAIRHFYFTRTGKFPTKEQLESTYGSLNDLLAVEITQPLENKESRMRLRNALEIIMLDLDNSNEALLRRQQARNVLKAEAPEIYS